MKREPAMELVKALRSGNFHQVHGKLHGLRQNPKGGNAPAVFGFCCLGVACEISKLGEWTGTGGEYYFESHACMPEAVFNYYGFKDECAMFDFTYSPPSRPHSVYTSLEQMNDDGMTFDEIADFIEQYWEVI